VVRFVSGWVLPGLRSSSSRGLVLAARAAADGRELQRRALDQRLTQWYETFLYVVAAASRSRS